MTLIEVFVPSGVLDDSTRTTLGERLVVELVSGPGTPADVIERARESTWLVFHEPQLFVGGHPVDGDPPRFYVRVTVPGGEVTDGMRAEIVARITRVLAEQSEDPDRFGEHLHAWVQIVEVADGGLGAFGRPLSTAEITGFIVCGAQPARNEANGEADVAIDPVCGMTVKLDDHSIVLEQGGRTVGFCSLICRDIFVKRALGTDS